MDRANRHNKTEKLDEIRKKIDALSVIGVVVTGVSLVSVITRTIHNRKVRKAFSD